MIPSEQQASEKWEGRPNSDAAIQTETIPSVIQEDLLDSDTAVLTVMVVSSPVLFLFQRPSSYADVLPVSLMAVALSALFPFCSVSCVAIPTVFPLLRLHWKEYKTKL